MKFGEVTLHNLLKTYRMTGSLIFFLLFVCFYLTKFTKGIFVLVLFSLMNDLIVFSFGFSLPLHFIISLFYVPTILMNFSKISSRINLILLPLYFEILYLIILAIIFGYIHPWEDSQDLLRSWSQKAEGRAVVQTFRLIIEFFLVFLVIFWLKTNKINMSFVVKSIVFLIIFNFIIAFLDVNFNGAIKNFLFSESRFITDRYTALNGEPRAFGRICVLTFLTLISLKNYFDNKKLLNFGLLISVIGLFLSLSASAILMFIVSVGLFFIFSGKYKLIITAIPVLIICYSILNQNEFFRQNTLLKIEATVLEENEFADEKVNSYEPNFFSHFEIFDRAALNFLYFNKDYIITGTGPNLISIPSSKYLTETNSKEYEDRIDSAPHSFIINLLARSGLIGLFLWLLFFFKLAKKTFQKSIGIFAFFMAIFIANMMVLTSYYLFALGIILYLVNEKKTQIKATN